MSEEDEQKRQRIAELNDMHRRTLTRCYITPGVQALPEGVLAELMKKVRSFDTWTPDNRRSLENSAGGKITSSVILGNTPHQLMEVKQQMWCRSLLTYLLVALAFVIAAAQRSTPNQDTKKMPENSGGHSEIPQKPVNQSNASGDPPWLPSLLGLGAIASTLLMTEGKWDIFDFIIAATIVVGATKYVSSSPAFTDMLKSGRGILVHAVLFGMVTAAGAVATISIVAVSVPLLAWVDAGTYDAVMGEKIKKGLIPAPDQLDLYLAQLTWQAGLFVLSTLGWGFSFWRRGRPKYRSPV